MTPPRHEKSYPDRRLDCEFALEPEFQALAERAEAIGWSAWEVAAAHTGLAAARLRMLAANRATDDAIRVVMPVLP